MPTSDAPATSLWQDVKAHFGLDRAGLGRLLGLSKNMVYQVETGRRPLPLAAAPAFTRLVLALRPAAPPTAPPTAPPAAPPTAPPAAPPTAPPAAPDPAAAGFAPTRLHPLAQHGLAQHGLACVATAARLATELAAAQARAAWAERRLAALPRLAAPLLHTDTVPPAWLAQFEREAQAVLAAYGPGVQARLALRRAGLLHEAAGVHRLLSGARPADLVNEQEAATFSHSFTLLPRNTRMAFSVSRFTTKAQCLAYLAKKAPERLLLAAHLGTVQATLSTWDAAGDPAADLATAQDMIDSLTPVYAATTDPKEKLKIERLLNSYRSRVTNLGGRAESHGADELLDREQDRDNATGDLAVLDALLAAVKVRHDALPA